MQIINYTKEDSFETRANESVKCIKWLHVRISEVIITNAILANAKISNVTK